MARIVGIGNPLFDVFAPAGENAHLVPPAGESGTHHTSAAQMGKTLENLHGGAWVAGGSARNTLAVLAMFSHQAYLVGVVGRDAQGERYRAALGEAGIADCLHESPEPTGVCLTLAPSMPRAGDTRTEKDASQDREKPGVTRGMEMGRGSETHVIVAPGAAAAATELEDSLPKNPDVVHLEGYAFSRRRLVEHVVEYAANSGALLSIDLAHPMPVGAYWSAVQARIVEAGDRLGWNRAPIVFGTEAEVEACAGGLEEARNTLVEAGFIVVVKKGPAGAAVFSRGERRDYPGDPVETVVDDTGAGDVFAGGFLAALLGGKPLGACCRIANTAAALSVKNLGGRLTPEQYGILFERFDADERAETP